MKPILHIFSIVFLTIITQIGGVIYLITLLLVRNKEGRRTKRMFTFSAIYLFSTFLIVPYVAPMFGREKIRDTEAVKAHSFVYKLANRNYVTPTLNATLQKIGDDFSKRFPGSTLVYLDANFPFFDRFPLLPHLSHNDGKKVDVSLIYQTKDGQLTNKKPSVSGYGVFEAPKKGEYDQIAICKKKNWFYDFPKYLTFGTINNGIEFSAKGTRELLRVISKQSAIGKIFLEPHLKNRLNLTNQKVRFHGCRAVRHDDHIHIQLR